MELEQKRSTQKLAEAGKPNLTGIPLQMKQSFERSSGLSFDDVRVHYHSALPARLGALAYTRGPHVYVGPGQEGHLGHELGHVIQQKQGRVRATSELGGVKFNTSPAMEREADTLSRQAARGVPIQMRQAPSSEVVQMVQYTDINAMWQGLCPGVNALAMIQPIINGDPILNELYQDAALRAPNCDFQLNANLGTPQITLNRTPPPTYIISHGNWPNTPNRQHVFISAIIHELSHAAIREQYHRNIPDRIRSNITPNREVKHVAWLDMNLPPNPYAAPAAVPIAVMARTPIPNLPQIPSDQWDSMESQKVRLRANIQYLRSVVDNDAEVLRGSSTVYRHLDGRLNYMRNRPLDHYDVVLGDMMFYLQLKGLQNTSSYRLMQRMLREANDRRHQRRSFGNNRRPYAFSSWPARLSRY